MQTEKTSHFQSLSALLPTTLKRHLDKERTSFVTHWRKIQDTSHCNKIWTQIRENIYRDDGSYHFIYLYYSQMDWKLGSKIGEIRLCIKLSVICRLFNDLFIIWEWFSVWQNFPSRRSTGTGGKVKNKQEQWTPKAWKRSKEKETKKRQCSK